VVKSKFISPVLVSSAVVCTIGGNFSSAMEDEKQAIELEKECKQGAADAMLFREFVKMIGGLERTQEFNSLLEEVRKIGKENLANVYNLIYNIEKDQNEKSETKIYTKYNIRRFLLSGLTTQEKKSIFKYANEEQIKGLFGVQDSRLPIALLSNCNFENENSIKFFFENVNGNQIKNLLILPPAYLFTLNVERLVALAKNPKLRDIVGKSCHYTDFRENYYESHALSRILENSAEQLQQYNLDHVVCHL
jgi:hypothetical protein